MPDSEQDHQQKEEAEISDSTQQTTSKTEAKPKKQKTVNKNKRANKIYRTPPTPSPAELLFKEKSFILDCNATSSISQDYSSTNPKLGPVIPPYNSQRDKHVNNYFKFYGVNRILKKTGQDNGNATSIEGRVSDRFHQKGPGFHYLSLRNVSGAGHSQETIDGHAQFMKGVKCVTGYNGEFGFRRNTPWLRKAPTPFGSPFIFPTH